MYKSNWSEVEESLAITQQIAFLSFQLLAEELRIKKNIFCKSFSLRRFSVTLKMLSMHADGLFVKFRDASNFVRFWLNAIGYRQKTTETFFKKDF